MEILGLDKIRKISDNTNLEPDVRGLEMIRPSDEGIAITGLDSIRSVFYNVFPKLSTFAMELLQLAGRAKELDREYRQYGAEIHHYEFAPVLGLSDVRDFEQRHRIQLPQAYVEFLTQVGNGGAGPDLGMFSLEELELRNFYNHSNRSVSYSMARGEKDFYTYPFALTNHTVTLNSYLTEQQWDGMCLELSRVNREDNAALYEQKRRALYSGVLQIADTDNSFCPALICCGDMAGEMSEFSHDLDMPRYYGKRFEDWILGYFEDVIARFGHK